MMRMLLLAGPASLFLFYASTALAEERIVPMAISGDWVAIAHEPTENANPDVCAAGNTEQNFSFGLSGSDLYIQLSENTWKLPANVSGLILIEVNNHSYQFEISTNSSTLVSAVITSSQLFTLIGDMDEAANMIVTPGQGDPISISLDGSNIALQAFLRCTNMIMPQSDPASNPFQ